MKKTFKIFVISTVFLFLCSIVGFLTKYISFDNLWIPLMIGAFLLLVSGTLALSFKKNLRINITSFLLNSIALGFCIRSWYIFREFDNSLWVMLGVSVIASLFIWIFYFYSRISLFETSPIFLTVLFISIFLVGYIALVISTKTTFLSTLGYYLIIELGFIFASISSVANDIQLFRKATISTFSVFIVALIIAILASGGDLDIDLSAFDIGTPYNQKKKNNDF